MRFPFFGFSAIGTLAMIACLQSCASRPPVASQKPPQMRESSPPVAVAASEQTKPPVAGPVEVPAPLQPTPPQPLTEPPASAESAKPAVADRPPPAEPGIAPVVQPKPKAVPKPAPKPQPAPSKPVPPPEPPPVVEEPPQPLATEPVEKEVLEEEVVVTLETLPINIGEEWTLSASGDVCTLSTLPVKFDDGQGMSRLQLVFTSQNWLVKTQSDIDMSYSGTGLTVDEGRHFPLEQLVRDTDLMFTKDYAAMTQAFMEARRLDISLGFWPSWPVSETKTITLSLQHFARAHRAWKSCQSLINRR
jgi:hypothetical protein